MTGKVMPLNVLAKEIKDPEKTESGLFIPITKRQTVIKAQAVMVGGDWGTVKMEINVGDRLLFSPNVARIVNHPDDNEEYLLLNQKDIQLYAW